MNIRNVISREMNTSDMEIIETISAEEIMTVEDEVRLIKQIQNKENEDGAKEKLIRANQRFVRVIAKKYVSPDFSLEELMAVGNIGLEHAIYKFDETQGFKFISYAAWWIRQSIQRHILSKKITTK